MKELLFLKFLAPTVINSGSLDVDSGSPIAHGGFRDFPDNLVWPKWIKILGSHQRLTSRSIKWGLDHNFAAVHTARAAGSPVEQF